MAVNPRPALLLAALAGLIALILSLGRNTEPPAPAPVAGRADLPATVPLPDAGRAPTAAGELRLGNPVVVMDTENGVLRAQLAVSVRLPSRQESWQGTVAVSGAPRLDAGSRRFYLERPQRGELALPGLPDTESGRVLTALDSAIADFFRNRPVFAPAEPAMPIEPLSRPLP
jgi:hypothetical protein